MQRKTVGRKSHASTNKGAACATAGDGDQAGHTWGQLLVAVDGEEEGEEQDEEGEEPDEEGEERDEEKQKKFLTCAATRQILGFMGAGKDARCLFCLQPFAEGHKVEVDHICPQHHRGPTHITNAALLHRECNRLKGTRSILSGPGIRAFHRVLREHGSSELVVGFMQLLGATVEEEMAAYTRPAPSKARADGLDLPEEGELSAPGASGEGAGGALPSATTIAAAAAPGAGPSTSAHAAALGAARAAPGASGRGAGRGRLAAAAPAAPGAGPSTSASAAALRAKPPVPRASGRGAGGELLAAAAPAAPGAGPSTSTHAAAPGASMGGAGRALPAAAAPAAPGAGPSTLAHAPPKRARTAEEQAALRALADEVRAANPRQQGEDAAAYAPRFAALMRQALNRSPATPSAVAALPKATYIATVLAANGNDGGEQSTAAAAALGSGVSGGGGAHDNKRRRITFALPKSLG